MSIRQFFSLYIPLVTEPNDTHVAHYVSPSPSTINCNFDCDARAVHRSCQADRESDLHFEGVPLGQQCVETGVPQSPQVQTLLLRHRCEFVNYCALLCGDALFRYSPSSSLLWIQCDSASHSCIYSPPILLVGCLNMMHLPHCNHFNFYFAFNPIAFLVSPSQLPTHCRQERCEACNRTSQDVNRKVRSSPPLPCGHSTH